MQESVEKWAWNLAQSDGQTGLLLSMILVHFVMFITVLGLYEMSPRKKANVYFLDFLFVQTLYLNSSLANGRHITVCIQYL